MHKLGIMLILLIWTCSNSQAQQIISIDTTQHYILPDVKVVSPASSLRVVPGKKLSRTHYTVTPGAGYAIRFFAPESDNYVLENISFWASKTHEEWKGQIKIQLAGVTPTGGPTQEPCYPPIILTAKQLHHGRLGITIPSLPVPQTGLFIVMEFLGAEPDQYVASHKDRKRRGPVLELHSSAHPERTPQQISLEDLPTLRAVTIADRNQVEVWHHLSGSQQWRVSPPGHSCPLIEASYRLDTTSIP